MKNFIQRKHWRHLSRASLLVPFLLISPLLTPNAQAVSIQMSGTRSVLSGTDCGIATYRFGTNTTFNGKQLDLLVEVLSEDNEYQGGQCIDAASNLLSVRLRDNDAGDNVAYMDIKITVVEKNTTTPVEVDRLTITGFDLDINPGGGTDTDDIYLKSPDGVYISSNSEVQYSEGSFFGGQYQAKLKGTSTRNCNDGATTTEISCRGGAIYINGGNGVNKVSSVTVRLQNDNAYGQASDTTSHRLLQLSFEISKFEELVTNNSDYGDTPNSYGSTGHSVGSNITLGYGLVPDHETAHQASINADGDDNDGAGSIKYDDEDGVRYNGQALNGQTLPAGSTSNLDITTFGSGYLSGWIDLNRDGDFNDAGEKVISDRSITSNTVSTTSVPITIPSTASGGTSYMRFRFTTTTGVAASGYSNSDGEVEDYQIVIAPATFSISGTLYEDTDNGDDFDSGEATLPANITVKLLDTNNNVVATTTTAANGTYTFTNITNGNYKIQVDTSDTDIPTGYTLGTPNNVAITVSGANISNINFGFDPPPPPPSGNAYCQSPYNEVYSGQSGNKIFAIHAPTGAVTQLTSGALASTVNSLATDHNNHLVYYAEGTSVYAWDAINNTHITITNNIRSFNSSLPANATLLSGGGAAFYNGSLYLGVDPPSAGVFEIYKVNFVPGSNGRTIQSVTPLNINGAGKANGQLNNGDWDDFIISDNGVIYGSSGGTAKYWSYNLNTNTFTDLVDNIPESSQLAKDGTGRLWAFRNGTNSVVQIEIAGNTIQTVGTVNSTGTHSSADAGECVKGASSIGDRVWNDINGNGVQDAGEGGFANVTVALYRDIDGDGVIDATDPQLDTQTTDANGNYDFTGLIFGNYIVKVTDTNQVLTGKTITTGTNTKAVSLPAGIQDYNNADFGFNQPVASNPNVLLVKRITAINGSSFTNLIDGVNNSNSPNYVPTPRDIDDNNPNWPNNYLQGLLNGGTVRPSDEIEYTIYFLSAGDATAPKVLICDRLPSNVTFIPTAFNNFAIKNGTGLPTADRGIIWQYNGNIESLTNAKDGDVAQYFPPGEDPTIVYPSIDCGGANTNGAVVVNLGNLPNATASGTPTNSYGFIRFRGRVK
ncbi:MAG: GEVED domain-containing protein [Fischerella sp.]|nr:GEVED domain-containing protein [Fischerella sp.]